MIRFISVALFVVIFLILSIPLLIAEWIIGKFNMDIKKPQLPGHCQLGVPLVPEAVRRENHLYR